MEQNDVSQKRDIQPQKRRTFKTVLLLALILLPTALAIVAFVLISDGFTFGAEKSLYEVKIYDTEGLLIDEESAYIDEAEEGSIVALLAPITTGFTGTTELPEDLDTTNHFRAEITYEGYTDEYLFFLSSTDDVGYCTVTMKKHYKLSTESVHNILSSKYAEIFYKTATPPTLYSSSGDIIVPESVSWRYKVASGEYFKSSSYELSNEISEYVMTGSLSLYFSSEPDICTITVSQNGNELYSGDYYSITELYINKNELIDIDVACEWSQTDESNYHGRINYSFKARISERPSFNVLGRSLDVNSFFVLKATNVEDISKLRVNCTPYIPHNIDFCGSGDSVVAIVPVTDDMIGSDYTVTLSYGAVSESFTVSVPIRENKNSTIISDVAKTAYDDAMTEDIEWEIELLKIICEEMSMTEKLNSGEFLDYADLDALKISKFNDYYFVDESTFYKTIGAEFRFGENLGVGVPVLNNGKVIRTGYNARLGNFVIVSHGAGLATWYTHLSITDVTEGQYVAKGEIVGKTGNSGLSSEDNVMIVATVGDVFIDATHLFGKEY